MSEDLLRLLTLQDYNTRVVLAGATLLGAAAGALGCFTLLRRRALMSDALSHATLPGIAAAFLYSVAQGGSGKELHILLLGAALSGVLGLVAMLAITHGTRLKEDAALGIVLSVFFGAGVALLGVVQKMGKGHAAGLESFIYGKAASMLAGDAWLIAGAAVVVLGMCALLFKEFRLLCFDAAFARSLGWRVLALDALLMLLVIALTVIGLQAVGLVLIIALLVVPAAAARFWTERLSAMLGVAALLGALSGLLGSAASALFPRLPGGAMVVLAAVGFFSLSMVLGGARGLLPRTLRRRRLARG